MNQKAHALVETVSETGIDILPPMTPLVRRLMYGILSWLAGLLTIASSVVALVDWDQALKPLAVANVVVLGLWTLGGFKAQGAVSSVKA